MAKKDRNKISIHDIFVRNYWIQEPKRTRKNQDFLFDIKLSFLINRDFIIKIGIIIDILEDEKTETQVVTLDTMQEFVLVGVEDYINKKKTYIPITILDKIISTAISNSRGILVALLSETKLSKAIIPFFETKSIAQELNSEGIEIG